MKFKTLPTLVTACLLPVLIALGYWQLNRAEQKRELLATESSHQSARPLELRSGIEVHADQVRYRRVKAFGHYDAGHQFLLDNQIKAGKPGFFVLTPFILESGGAAVLVNRGWLPLGPRREVLPNVEILAEHSTIEGRINFFPSVGLKLAGADMPAPGWPSLLQVVNPGKLAKMLGYPVASFMVELDPQSADGYRRDWQEAKLMPPEQHVAYAWQWFGLALTLALLWVWHQRLK